MALQVIDYKGTKVLSNDGLTPLDPINITGEGGAMLQEDLIDFADRVTINDGLAHAQAHALASHIADVNITTPADDDILRYDSGTGKWLNINGTGGAGTIGYWDRFGSTLSPTNESDILKFGTLYDLEEGVLAFDVDGRILYDFEGNVPMINFWDAGTVNFFDNNVGTTGTGTFGDIIDNGLTASLGVYTDGSKQLTSTAPTVGILGHWLRAGTDLDPANSGDTLRVDTIHEEAGGSPNFDVLNRTFFDANGATSYDYNAHKLYNEANRVVQDHNLGLFYDEAESLVMNTVNQMLVRSGDTILDWSTAGTAQFGDSIIITSGSLILTPDEIIATNAGVAASITTSNTEVATNGDSDLDNVTLANGVSGQIKNIYCVVEGNAGDTWKITPANMVGGAQITFAGAGQGCTLAYADSEGWVVTANNGGAIT